MFIICLVAATNPSIVPPMQISRGKGSTLSVAGTNAYIQINNIGGSKSFTECNLIFGIHVHQTQPRTVQRHQH